MKMKLPMIEAMFESDYKGLVFIDENREMALCSDYAKKITGIILEENKTHEAGRLEKGDIVIIADNKIGNDDELDISAMSKINLSDPNIKYGDAIVAVGVYENNKIKTQYKCIKNHNPNGVLELNIDYLGIDIISRIDFGQRLTEIIINGESYPMSYFESVGNMVVADRVTGNVKFYQARGYGYRHEEIGRLLNGEDFSSKKNDVEDKLQSESILEYGRSFFDSEVKNVINKVFGEENGYIVKGIYEIYKRPMYCVFIRIKGNDEYDGVYITIQDVSLLEDIRKERDAIIKLLEEWQRKKSIGEEKGEYDNLKLADYIGKDPSMKEVKYFAYRASKGKFNVIITGESGTGKTRLAREIHNMWNKEAPFVEVNCNAIAPTLIESELFGYVPGAFTGATEKGKKGFFEEADGGTIFLDEIGDIPLEIQVKLLHVLQNKKIYPVGSTKPIEVNTRVIVATNKDLEKEVKEGRFRQDLYYRIKVFPIHIPPLRQRKNDLYILINSVLSNICDRYDIDNKMLSEEALEKMLNYNWPGNVRELENVLERAVILCDSPVIYSEYILIDSDTNESHTLKDRMQKEEARIIAETLLKNRNDKQKTMAELNLSKTSFYEKLNKYKMI